MTSEFKNGKYFTFNELIRSEKAEELSIDNVPVSDDIITNIYYTIGRLDEIREGYGKPIIITSGFRCNELNKAVGGKDTSYHLQGLAVDIKWDSELVEYIIKNCKFHKLIREKAGNTKWLHIQFKLNVDEEAQKVISITK